MSSPQHTAGWVLGSQTGIKGLRFVDQLPLPPLKEDDVLVRIHAASLNHRDLMIAKGGPGIVLGKNDLVPGSDGAGIVEAVGSKVSAFGIGDHNVRNRSTDFGDIGAGLGQTVDGTLRQHGIFHETSLVRMPSHLSFLEAATLPCAGLTAWNALFGLESKAPKAGDAVLVQGTGGVSIAALQFAVAAGATVLSTTSSDGKANRLKSLGAQHVINYRETPDWGERAKTLTDGNGVDVVVDVGGASTLQQSLKAIRTDGLIAATGILGDSPDSTTPTLIDCIFFGCTTRGGFLGSRKQFNDMNHFLETHGIRPVLDPSVFDLASVKEAYTFMMEQKHFSKVCIRLC